MNHGWTGRRRVGEEDEQVWLSRGDGGVPDVIGRIQTSVSAGETVKLNH